MFTELKKKVVDELENWGMLEEFKDREKIKIEDAKGTIDKIVMVTSIKLDDKGEIVLNKKGKEIPKYTTYIAFDGNKVSVCISKLIGMQLSNLMGVKCENGIEYPELVGVKFKIEMTDTKYANGKTFKVATIVDQ